jgi:hypothetical protein
MYADGENRILPEIHPEPCKPGSGLLTNGQDKDGAKISKPHIWVNRKIAERGHCLLFINLPVNEGGEKYLGEMTALFRLRAAQPPDFAAVMFVSQALFSGSPWGSVVFRNLALWAPVGLDRPVG